MNKEIERLVNDLLKRNLTISSMESCTGGGIANEITNNPGVSRAFKFSAVTYSNEFKVKMGVDEKVIEKFSVYSAETAAEMSRAISEFTGSSFGIGVTGKLKRFDHSNDCGEDDEVFLCVYDRINQRYLPDKIKVHHKKREDNKQEVISAAAKLALKAIKASERSLGGDDKNSDGEEKG